LTTPDLKLRRTWNDGGQPREDYEVIDARGERVGRMYRTIAVGGGEAWNWTVYGIAVTNYPPAGQAPTRAAAQAAFQGSVGNLPAAGAGRLMRSAERQILNRCRSRFGVRERAFIV
jgi:hypothetical protein